MPHDLWFRDELEQSGIDWSHRAVEDGGKYYRMTHWDHGSGLAVADVDGDGLPDLYFCNQVGGNGLWRNRGDGSFEDWTARAGVALAERNSVAAAFADLDNDGDPDLYVTTVRGGNALFENLGDGRFRDRSAESGLDYVGHPSAPVFADFDLDGRLDLLLVVVGRYTGEERGGGGYHVGLLDAFAGHLFGDRTERSRIYGNLQDWRFVDVSALTGFRDGSWSGDALVVDLDRDRFPDIFLLNMQGDDHFYRNEGGERFSDRTDDLFPRTSWGSMGAVQLDYDGDGDIDVFVTDMHSDMSEEIGPEREGLKSRMQWGEETLQGGDDNLFGNSFFRADGEDAFTEVSDEIGVENYWPWGVSAGDINADGWEDLFVTASMNFPWRYQVNSVLLNNAGREFVATEFLLGVEPRRDGRTYAPWFDLDCGGGDRGHVLCPGHEAGRLRVEGALGSRSSVVIDLDRDGDLDIVTSDFNSEPQVLLSDLAQRGEPRWLEIDLEGTTSNRDGLGATVEVDVGERTLVRYVNGKTGYLSQGSRPEYFGLGEAGRAEDVRVLWPSGCRQVLGPQSAGSRLTVTESCESG